MIEPFSVEQTKFVGRIYAFDKDGVFSFLFKQTFSSLVCLYITIQTAETNQSAVQNFVNTMISLSLDYMLGQSQFNLN